MATEVLEQAEASGRHMSKIDIEGIVAKPIWKEILMDLIISERLDPWNIDIVSIADGFLKRVREMKTLDLLVPANVILASAILLKYKSNFLRLYEPQPEVMQPTEEVPYEEEIPPLVMSSRIPPKSQITLEDLTSEIERVIRYDGTEYVRKHKGGIEEFVNLKVTQEDIEKKMDDLHAKLMGSADSEGWVLFSNLVKEAHNVEKIYTLLSVLHLTQKKKIDLRQDEIFGEIFIYVKKEN